MNRKTLGGVSSKHHKSSCKALFLIQASIAIYIETPKQIITRVLRLF